MQQIEALKEQLGFSILFITHDLSLLVELSTRIGIMYAGEIVERAPSRLLFTNPLHPYTQGLMNSFPSLNGPRRRLTGIPGAPPDMVAPPSGCRFHPRCPHAMPVCAMTAPQLVPMGEGHTVGCHLYPQPNVTLLRTKPDAVIASAEALMAADGVIDAVEADFMDQVRELLGR